jgi:hypothetical protein
LRAFGKTSSTRLLFAGPPGSGKTMTAAALAGQLHLPLFTVRFDALITRCLGETVAKLQLIFHHIATTRGVFLFEFDAKVWTSQSSSLIFLGCNRRSRFQPMRVESFVQQQDGQQESGSAPTPSR